MDSEETKEQKKTWQTEMDTAHEVRYVRNELARIRDVLTRQEDDTKEALLTLSVDLTTTFKELMEEIRLARQTYVLMGLSSMTKLQRRKFLEIIDMIQREDKFLEAFGGVGDTILNVKKLKKTI